MGRACPGLRLGLYRAIRVADSGGMNFGNPWSLLSGVVISLVGMVLFMRGKKDVNLPCLGAGVALCVFPYFVSSLLLMWGLFAVCMGGWWWMARQDVG